MRLDCNIKSISSNNTYLNIINFFFILKNIKFKNLVVTPTWENRTFWVRKNKSPLLLFDECKQWRHIQLNFSAVNKVGLKYFKNSLRAHKMLWLFCYQKSSLGLSPLTNCPHKSCLPLIMINLLESFRFLISTHAC